MITSKEISFVVQGAVNTKETRKCLKSIRKYMPDSEIILSTWDGSDVSGLDYDILILNKDPGAVYLEYRKNYHNLNRQLFSTQEGLKRVTRKYAMKLRSDMILTSDKFLEYFDKFQKRSANYNLFKRKVLIPAIFTRFNVYKPDDPKSIFHISDLWLFGLKEDLDTYFLDTKLVEELYFAKYFEREENKNKSTRYGKNPAKFPAECYFGYSCFHRNFKDIYMDDASDYSDELMEKFRECLVNNFIVLEFKHSGIRLNKYLFCQNEKFLAEEYLALYNFYRYEYEYKKYCDFSYEITSNKRFFENERYGTAILRFYKHIYRLINNKHSILAKTEYFFTIIPIAIITLIQISRAVLQEK